VTISPLEPLERARQCRKRTERRRIDGSAGARDGKSQAPRHAVSGARREHRVQQSPDRGLLRFFARRVLDVSVGEEHQVVEPQRTIGVRVPLRLQQLLDYRDRFVRGEDRPAVEQLRQRNPFWHVPTVSARATPIPRVPMATTLPHEVCYDVSPVVDVSAVRRGIAATRLLLSSEREHDCDHRRLLPLARLTRDPSGRTAS